MLIFVTFLAGVIFRGFHGYLERFRLTRTINRLNKTIRDLRREMKGTENPPYIEPGGKTIPPAEIKYRKSWTRKLAVLEARSCFMDRMSELRRE